MFARYATLQDEPASTNPPKLGLPRTQIEQQSENPIATLSFAIQRSLLAATVSTSRSMRAVELTAAERDHGRERSRDALRLHEQTDRTRIILQISSAKL